MVRPDGSGLLHELDFDRQAIDAEPARRSLQLIALGARATVNGFSIDGGDGTFTLDPEQRLVGIKPGKPLQVDLRFTPRRPGLRTGELVMNRSRRLGPIRIPLRGQATSSDAALQVDIPNTNLGGDTPDGEARLTKDFGQLRNTGGKPL